MKLLKERRPKDLLKKHPEFIIVLMELYVECPRKLPTSLRKKLFLRND